MLDKRLKVAASYVRSDCNCVDVGTDHAYLAVYLYENKITEHIVACDINEKPLNAAKRTIKEHNLTGKIEVIQSNGLQNISSDQAQDIIICGMGGELIMSIILSSSYTKSSDKRFILQPMTNAPYLRKSLYENGYEIISETPVIDKNHVYTVMLVQYTGSVVEISPLFSMVGKISNHKSDASEKYIMHQFNKQKKMADGLKKSSEKAELADDCEKLADEIKQLLEEK
ncbi:MAG: class I SAM-dependent methyltransferase [Oscillospiraceae bacterium]